MEYAWMCAFCDTVFEVKEDVDGECPGCHAKYTWGYDGDHGHDSLWSVKWLKHLNS